MQVYVLNRAHPEDAIGQDPHVTPLFLSEPGVVVAAVVMLELCQAGTLLKSGQNKFAFTIVIFVAKASDIEYLKVFARFEGSDDIFR